MSKVEPGDIHQRVGPHQRATLLARAREQRLDGILVQSWRHESAPPREDGPSQGAADTAALWLPVSGGPVLVVHPPSSPPTDEAQAHASSPDPDEMTVVHSGNPLGYVPRGAARIAVVRENLDAEQPCGQTAPVAAAADAQFSVADLASWTGQAQHVGSAHRLRGLQHAAQTGDLALRAAADSVREGATDVAIAAVVEAAAIAHGADRARCLVGMGHGNAVTDAHGAMYRPGQLVRLELNLVQDGFACHAQQTVLVDSAAGDLEAVEVCYEAREALLTRIAPGAAVAEVVAAGDQVLADFGLLRHKEGVFGHGIGWDVTEPPFLVAESLQTIQAGSVLAVHVGVVGSRGETALVGGPVLVSEDGSQELVPGACWTRSRSDLAPGGTLDMPLLVSPHVTGFRGTSGTADKSAGTR